MIKTIFFPFSHISKDQLKTVTSFFSGVTFLPMVTDFSSDPVLADLAGQGTLLPLFPLARDLELVEKQVQSYIDWADIHRGNEKNLRSLLKEQPYFMEDTALSTIQSQIRKGIKKETSPDQNQTDIKESEHDPLLLLKFAQILDVQNEGIDDQLNNLEQSKSSLFLQLLGEIPEKNSGRSDSSISSPSSPDPGRIMTHERIVSWFRYAAEKGMFNVPGAFPFLITTSPAVLDYMESKCGGVINALDIDSIKVHENKCVNKDKWQQNLFLHLEEAIAGKSFPGMALPEVDDRCLVPGRIKLCLFPEQGMEKFLNIPGQSIAVCLVQLKS